MSDALLTVAPQRWARSAFARLRSLWQRWFLWLLLAVLVSVLLVTVVWLAGRHEVEQVQAQLDRDTADAVSDLRSGFQRNAQSLRATQTPGTDRAQWNDAAAALLREHREWLRLEWRDAGLRPLEGINTPYRMRLLDEASRGPEQSDVMLACAAARKLGAGAYSPSHYVPIAGGGGVEVMEFCVPIDAGGFLVASYSLRDALIELVGPTLTRGQEVSFTEADGTRLVALGSSRRVGTRVFSSQQLIDLPGTALMLRVDGCAPRPTCFPTCSRRWSPRSRSRWCRCWCCSRAIRGDACAPSATWPMRSPFARPWKIRSSQVCAHATCRGASPT
jgi:two-component system sensor histidine kinase DctS